MATFLTPRGGEDGIPILFDTDVSGGSVVTFRNKVLDDDPKDPAANGTVTVFYPWGGPYRQAYAYFHRGSRLNGNPLPPQGGAPQRLEPFAEVVLRAHPSLPEKRVIASSGETIVPVDGAASAGGSFGGNTSVTVKVDEYLYVDSLDRTEATYFPDPNDPNALGFPVTGGNAMPDSVPAKKTAHYVVPKIGQTVTVTATINGASVSQSFVWGPGDAFYHGVAVQLYAQGYKATGSCSANPEIQGVALFEQADHSFSQGGATWNANGGLSLSAGADPGIVATLDADAELPMAYRQYASFVGSDGTAWNAPLTVVYPGGSHAVTGTGSWDIKQKSWYVEDRLEGNLVDVDGVTDEKGWMTAAIAQSSLRASRLDTRDWRLRFKTYRVPGLTLSHSALRTVSSSTAATLAFSGEGDLWGGYRYLERMVTAPKGRKVSVNVSGGNVGKTFESKKLSDGPEWVRFDLCSPSNLPAVTDGAFRRDSRYPLRPQPTHHDGPVNAEPDDDLGYLDAIVDPPLSGEDPDASLQTWTMGVYDVSSAAFSIDSQDGDAAVAWGETRLVSVAAPKVTLSEGFCGQGKILQDGYDCLKLWPMSAAGGRTSETGSVWGSPFFHASVDGRLVYDLPGNAYRQFVVGGYEWAYDPASLLGNALSHYPGWTCAVSDAAPNFYGYSAQSAYANDLGGEGSLFDGTGWTHHVDVAPGSIQVQDSCDWYRGWPYSGDPFGGPAPVGKPCPLAVGKILGVRSQGFALQNDDAPEPGKPLVGVEAWNERTDFTGTTDATVQTTFGKGTSGADGSYSTTVLSGPVGRPKDPYTYDGFEGGDETATTTLQTGAKPQETSRFRSRWIKRTTFRGVLVQRAGGGIATLHTPDGRYWRADVVVGGIRVRTALNGGPARGWYSTVVVPTGEGTANPCLTWDANTSLGHLVWDEKDGIHEAYSKSMGKTWGDPALSSLIPGGRIPRRRHTFPGGDAIEFAVVDDGGSGAGKLVGVFRGRGDTEWSAPFDVKVHPSSSVDPGQTFRLEGDASAPIADYDVFPGHTSDGRWSLSIRRVGESEPSEWFSVEHDARRFKPAGPS